LVASILNEMVQPGGEVVGIDFSEERICHAEESYGGDSGIQFKCQDLRKPLGEQLGRFDLIWVRFVLEYFRSESPEIVKMLSASLKPGGLMCLVDLDYNCLTHYELDPEIEKILFKLMKELEQKYNFDPFAGRKLYAFLYDLGFQDIQVNVSAHHLIYGHANDSDFFNWYKKVEVASQKAEKLFENYPGGGKGFLADFKSFFRDPRRFTYTPLILCKGIMPSATSSMD
ncbi:class I SAM-dependent methyltransferase, partial [Thermodesulfobacteriota bacterium]